jgi:hypothetical protein
VLAADGAPVASLFALSTASVYPETTSHAFDYAERLGYVASAVLDIFDVPELEVCPWALREGVILDRLDRLGALG